MTKKSINTIDELAQLMKQGFDGVDRQFKAVNKKLDSIGADVQQLSRICKQGFDDTVSRDELFVPLSARSGRRRGR